MPIETRIASKQRQSGIELLKIIAIIFILLSHSMPDGDAGLHSSAIDINLGMNLQVFIIQILHNFGQIGNDIFIVCSCWFLIDSVEVRGEKIATLFGDAFFVSVFSLVIFSIIGYRFPTLYFIRQFIPVINGNSWFLPCYILLYAIHPLLNIIISELNKKQLCSFSACLFVMYCCIYFVLHNDGFFYSEIIGFITIYYITAYVKKYLIWNIRNTKTSSILIILSVVCMVGVNIFSNYVTMKTGKGLYSRWNDFINPQFLIMAFGGLGIALNGKFSNRIINYISSLSLLIYITHTNRIVRDYVRFDFFQYVLDNYTYSNLLGWCFVFFGIFLIYSVIFALVYKKLFKNNIAKGSIIVYKMLSSMWNKIINSLTNFWGGEIKEDMKWLNPDVKWLSRID